MAGPSGATARLALPYPTPSDTADVPRDVQALATKLDGIRSVGTPFVTAMPASPTDGDEVYFVAEAATGVTWHLIYSSALSGWIPVGDAPIRNDVAASESTNSTTYTDLATLGPQITVPLRGTYEITVGAFVGVGGAGAVQADMSYAQGAAAPRADAAAVIKGTGVSGTVQRSSYVFTMASAGDVMRAKYKVAPATACTWLFRFMLMRPLWISP